jgi:uncharacterized protein YjbI with pentapeptide repeats
MRGVKLVGADLKKAKLQDANLSGADLTGAAIDGADFTGANLAGVTVEGLDLSKAKNLAPQAARTAGPNMRELAKVAAASSSQFQTSIEVDLGPNEFVTLRAMIWHYGGRGQAGGGYVHQKPGANVGNTVQAPTLEQGMLNLTDMWLRGSPKFETVEVEAKKGPLRGKELVELATAAWYEAFGLAVPTEEELQERKKQAAADSAALREIMLAELHGGPAGVKKWNARSDKERARLGSLRKHDFTHAKLAGVRFENQNLEGAAFDDADLRDAKFDGAQLKRASFARANLSGAWLAASNDASFEDAVMTGCNLRAASYRRCNFRGANLTKANLSYADIGGADFTGATLTNADLSQTKFDEKTVFPAGFTPPDEMVWKGAGMRPGTPAPAPPPPSGTLDFEAFLEQLNNKVEQARMQKAASMLKAESFQLFADVKDDSLVGIVKSQSNKELVYSCRLAADGAFGCCTQNLRPCGGLRGALCKHLLVLIVGLAKAGQLDSATVDHWIDLSRRQKPAIDEEVMSATFLRYKGAEAGEVDWRPTETIPEDFYVM